MILVMLGYGGYWWLYNVDREFVFLSPQSDRVSIEPTPLPLLPYSFDALSDQTWPNGEIEIGDEMDGNWPDGVEAYVFYFSSEGRRVSGMLTVPEGLIVDGEVRDGVDQYPVIVMLRGFVARDIYRTGIGTAPSAQVYAQNGYVTVALDYMGFGDSDAAYDDVWQERFSRPVQVMNLLSSLGSLAFVDTQRIGMWGHSNGGQVALSVLEITRAKIPTTLWAPVTKPFPYAILYFTDEADDEGWALRQELYRLERDYDVRDYSISGFLDRIQAPLQLHQGTADDAVPVEWSREFVQKIRRDNEDIEIEYFEYNGADHQLNGGWDRVVARDLNFFDEYLSE